jgi:hypothetical protein
MQKPGGSTGVFSTVLRKTGHSSPIGAVSPRGSGLSQSLTPPEPRSLAGLFLLLFRNRTGYPKLIQQVGFIGGSGRCAGTHFVGRVQVSSARPIE